MAIRDSKESYNQYMVEWRKKNNAAANKSRWKSSYKNMTDDVEKAYEKYINATHCECCGIELIMKRDDYRGAMPGNSKCQDHCHITKRLRGVICLNCNTMEGHAKTPEKAYQVACYMAENIPLTTLIRSAQQILEQ